MRPVVVGGGDRVGGQSRLLMCGASSIETLPLHRCWRKSEKGTCVWMKNAVNGGDCLWSEEVVQVQN